MRAEVVPCSMSRDAAHVRSDLSVFSQDWWLDIARTSSDFREVKVVRGNRIVGRLPFVIWRNRLGLSCGQDPYWSHLRGPILEEGLERPAQAEVIGLLLEQLPRWTSYSFVCDPNLAYADLVRNAFRDAGFEHSTQITYVRFPGETDVLDSRKRKHRGHIKRAAKSLACVDISANEFVQFFEANLKRKGKRSYAPIGDLLRLIEEAIGRGCARAIAARPHQGDEGNESGEGGRGPYDAAIIYLWDSSRCYYWLSTHRVFLGGNPADRPHPDAIKLLAVKAMEHAQEMNLIFDADGVVTPGADNLYRNIFALKSEQRRDVFKRWNALERIYQTSRRTLHRSNSLQESRAFLSRMRLHNFFGPRSPRVPTAGSE
jgi:hypothetical protein